MPRDRRMLIAGIIVAAVFLALSLLILGPPNTYGPAG